jgi:hypothetical protein
VNRAVRPTMTRARSWGSHRLRRCTDVPCIPCRALPVEDRHVTSCRASRPVRSHRPGKRPARGRRDAACRPGRRDASRARRPGARRTAQPAGQSPRREGPARRRLTAVQGVSGHGFTRPGHRALAAGRSRRLCTVSGRLRTAIGASNAEPSHHPLLRSIAPAGQVRASCCRSRAPLCGINRLRAALERNKPHVSATEVSFSHICHRRCSASALRPPTDRNSLHSDTQRSAHRFIALAKKVSSSLVIGRRPSMPSDEGRYSE